MALGFGSTLGSGTTDSVVTALTSHSTTRSYSIWANRNGSGGGSLGRMFEKRTSGAQVELLYVNNNLHTSYNYSRNWSGATADWEIAQPGTGSWNHVGVTYDGGSSANTPVMYLNGVSQSVTTNVAASGSINTNSDPYVIGNRTNDNARVWDGSLAEFAIWNVILDAAEMAALGAGISPLLIRPASLVLYVPLVRELLDVKNAPPTKTGTAVQPHPRVYQPYRPTQFYHATGGAPPSASGGASYGLCLVGVN